MPVEQAYDIETKGGRILKDLSGRDYFFNFTEYLAHRLERMSAAPSAKGPVFEMANMV